MIALGESKTSDVKYLLTPYHHTETYNKLKEILTTEQMIHFAKPDIHGGQAVVWTLDIDSEKSVKKLESLSKEEQDDVMENFAIAKKNIEQIFNASKDQVVEKISQYIFCVPGEKSIKAVWHDHRWHLVLIQWGCVDSADDRGRTIIDVFLNRPRSNVDNVTIGFYDVSDSPLPDFPFYLNYKKNEISEIANKEGQFKLGECSIGSKLEVFAAINGKKRKLEEFSVVKEGIYKVVVPQYHNFKVKILNQKGEPVANESFTIQSGANSETRLSAEDGIILFEDVEVGKELELIDNYNPSSTLKIKCTKDKDYYEFLVGRSKLLLAKINVVNSSNLPKTDYALKIERENQTTEMHTDSNGMITLDNCKDNEKIKAINLKNERNYITCEVKETDQNEFTLIIIEEPEKRVKIKFVDHKDIPLKNASVTFTFNNKTVTANTDGDGCCYFNANEFVDKEKVKMNIIPEKKKSKT